MWRCGMVVSGHGGDGLMVGLGDLGGLLQLTILRLYLGSRSVAEWRWAGVGRGDLAVPMYARC